MLQSTPPRKQKHHPTWGHRTVSSTLRLSNLGTIPTYFYIFSPWVGPDSPQGRKCVPVTSAWPSGYFNKQLLIVKTVWTHHRRERNFWVGQWSCTDSVGPLGRSASPRCNLPGGQTGGALEPAMTPSTLVDFFFFKQSHKLRNYFFPDSNLPTLVPSKMTAKPRQEKGHRPWIPGSKSQQVPWLSDGVTPGALNTSMSRVGMFVKWMNAWHFGGK